MMSTCHPMQDMPDETKTVVVYTNGKVTISSLQGSQEHSFIIEGILNPVGILDQNKWQSLCIAMKTHVRDAGNDFTESVYVKNPKSNIKAVLN